MTTCEGVTLSVDFDRVIHDLDHPLEGRRMGPPMAGAVEAMQELADRGFRLIIYTLRAAKPEGYKHVAEWLDYYGIPYAGISGVKPDALIYIDDRGLRHTDWPSTMEAVYGLTGVEPDE